MKVSLLIQAINEALEEAGLKAEDVELGALDTCYVSFDYVDKDDKDYFGPDSIECIGISIDGHVDGMSITLTSDQ